MRNRQITHIQPDNPGPAGCLLAATRAWTRRRLLPLLCLLSLFLAGTPLAGTPDIQDDYRQTQTLTRALGRVLLSHRSTLALLGVCAQDYPHLAGTAEQARQTLIQADQPVVEKARAVQAQLTRRIADQLNKFDAEKFSIEIDAAVRNATDQFKHSLTQYSRQDRHYVCNRLILSVRAGDWNVHKREPEATGLILNFK